MERIWRKDYNRRAAFRCQHPSCVLNGLVTKRGFLVGLLGGANRPRPISFVIRIVAGGVFLPELAAQTLFTLTPGAIESKAVETLQSLAKYSAFTAAVVRQRPGLRHHRRAALQDQEHLGRTPAGSRGSSRSPSSPTSILAAVGVALLFTTAIQSSPVSLPGPPCLDWSHRNSPSGRRSPMLKGGTKPTDLLQGRPASRRGKKFDRRRRLFIKAGVASAVGAAILVYGVGFLLRPSNASTVQASPNSLYPQNVTSNGNFYRVDVNIFPPTVDSSTWNLKVFGLVNTELNLDLAQTAADGGGGAVQHARVRQQHDRRGPDQHRPVDRRQAQGRAEHGRGPVLRRLRRLPAVDGYDVGIPLDTAMLDGDAPRLRDERRRPSRPTMGRRSGRSYPVSTG